MEQGDENVKDKGETGSTQRYGRYPSVLHCEHCKKRSKKSHGRSTIQRTEQKEEKAKMAGGTMKKNKLETPVHLWIGKIYICFFFQTHCVNCT
jgi:hypothetical protein